MTDDELQAFIEGLEWQQENASGVTLEEHELPTVLQALRQMRDQQWRTIDSAPRDGDEVLLLCGDDVIIGSFRRDDNAKHEPPMWLDNSFDDFSCGYMSVPLDPTHWMPLPQPPEDTK
jgi:hypothetical protein